MDKLNFFLSSAKALKKKKKEKFSVSLRKRSWTHKMIQRKATEINPIELSRLNFIYGRISLFTFSRIIYAILWDVYRERAFYWTARLCLVMLNEERSLRRENRNRNDFWYFSLYRTVIYAHETFFIHHNLNAKIGENCQQAIRFRFFFLFLSRSQ